MKQLMTQKHDANQKLNKTMTLTKNKTNIIRDHYEIKQKYKESMLANTFTGTNIMTPWRGIKNVWNLGKLSDSDFNLLYVTEEQKLADETNVGYFTQGLMTLNSLHSGQILSLPSA